MNIAWRVSLYTYMSRLNVSGGHESWHMRTLVPGAGIKAWISNCTPRHSVVFNYILMHAIDTCLWHRNPHIFPHKYGIACVVFSFLLIMRTLLPETSIKGMYRQLQCNYIPRNTVGCNASHSILWDVITNPCPRYLSTSGAYPNGPEPTADSGVPGVILGPKSSET